LYRKRGEYLNDAWQEVPESRIDRFYMTATMTATFRSMNAQDGEFRMIFLSILRRRRIRQLYLPHPWLELECVGSSEGRLLYMIFKNSMGYLYWSRRNEVWEGH